MLIRCHHYSNIFWNSVASRGVIRSGQADPPAEEAGHRAGQAALADGDEIDVGGLTLRALATPGYTDEHLSYLLLDRARGTTGIHRRIADRRADCPDRPATAIAEMKRVLVPGGRLLLLDHIGSTWPPVYAAQWLLERITIRSAGEHFTRRQLPLVEAAGFQVVETERLKAGSVERIHAVKPGQSHRPSVGYGLLRSRRRARLGGQLGSSRPGPWCHGPARGANSNLRPELVIKTLMPVLPPRARSGYALGARRRIDRRRELACPGGAQAQQQSQGKERGREQCDQAPVRREE